MSDVRLVDIVDKKVRDAQEVGERLPFLTEHGGLELRQVGGALDLRVEVVQRRDEESARAGREVAKPLAKLRIETRDDEVRKGAGRVEFAGVARALEVFEDTLVDVAESVPVFCVGKVDLVDDVHDLAEKDAILLVLVEVGEHLADDCLAHGRLRCDDNALERGEKLVDEREELFAREGGADILAVGVLRVSPIAPAVFFRDD